MNGVFKRKRPEIKKSNIEIAEPDNLEYLGKSKKSINPLSEVIILIVALKEVIKQQNNTIKSIQNNLIEIKEQNKQLQNKLDTIIKCSVVNTPANTSPNPSYTDMAQTPSNSIPANLNSILSIRIMPLIITNILFCTINISRVISKDTNKTLTGAIRRTIEREIQTLKNQTN